MAALERRRARVRLALAGLNAEYRAWAERGSRFGPPRSPGAGGEGCRRRCRPDEPEGQGQGTKDNKGKKAKGKGKTVKKGKKDKGVSGQWRQAGAVAGTVPCMYETVFVRGWGAPAHAVALREDAGAAGDVACSR